MKKLLIQNVTESVKEIIVEAFTGECRNIFDGKG